MRSEDSEIPVIRSGRVASERGFLAEAGDVFPERARWGLLVRRPSIGGAENAACFSYSQALQEGDGAALLGAQAGLPTDAPAELGEQRSEECTEDLARQLGVVSAAVTERVGKGEHPLPPERAPLRLFVRMRLIGGGENAACFAYPHAESHFHLLR
jgi:hypothetical protein